jgi:hypothetical protein
MGGLELDDIPLAGDAEGQRRPAAVAASSSQICSTWKSAHRRRQ